MTASQIAEFRANPSTLNRAHDSPGAVTRKARGKPQYFSTPMVSSVAVSFLVWIIIEHADTISAMTSIRSGFRAVFIHFIMSSNDRGEAEATSGRRLPRPPCWSFQFLFRLPLLMGFFPRPGSVPFHSSASPPPNQGAQAARVHFAITFHAPSPPSQRAQAALPQVYDRAPTTALRLRRPRVADNLKRLVRRFYSLFLGSVSSFGLVIRSGQVVLRE